MAARGVSRYAMRHVDLARGRLARWASELTSRVLSSVLAGPSLAAYALRAAGSSVVVAGLRVCATAAGKAATRFPETAERAAMVGRAAAERAAGGLSELDGMLGDGTIAKRAIEPMSRRLQPGEQRRDMTRRPSRDAPPQMTPVASEPELHRLGEEADEAAASAAAASAPPTVSKCCAPLDPTPSTSRSPEMVAAEEEQDDGGGMRWRGAARALF